MNWTASRLVIVIAVAGVAFWLIRSVRHPDYTNYPPRAGETWVAFGDSLTAGTGASPDHDYPTQLGQRLGITILNQGVPGDTTANGLTRVGEIIQLKPRVVLLCLGGNDGLQQLPLAETIGNLAAIIERLQAAGAFVVVIGIRSASALDQYAGSFKKLARDHKALFVPNLLQGVLAHPQLMSDQVHPNDAGYTAIAARLETILRPLLPVLQAQAHSR